MDRFKRIKNTVSADFFLPLFLLSDEKIFYAAVLIPLVAGITMFLFEIIRTPAAPELQRGEQPRDSLAAFYLFWLAGCGALAWLGVGIPPYWIWSVYLIVPKSIWAPSDAQRKKPFLYGFKKYSKRRIFELVSALAAASVFAGFSVWLRPQFQGAMSWVIVLFVLLICEIFFTTLRRQKK